MKMLSYHLKIDRCYIDERAIKGLAKLLYRLFMWFNLRGEVMLYENVLLGLSLFIMLTS
jgi:hypothetical protein